MITRGDCEHQSGCFEPYSFPWPHPPPGEVSNEAARSYRSCRRRNHAPPLRTSPQPARPQTTRPRWYPGAGAMATHGYFSRQKVGVRSPLVSQEKNQFAGGDPHMTGQAGQNSLLGVFRPDRHPFFRVSSWCAICGSDGGAVAGASCTEARCDDDLSKQTLSFGCKRRQPVFGYHPVER